MRKFLGALLAAFVLGLLGPATAQAIGPNASPAALRQDDDKDKKKKNWRHHRHRRHHHHRHHKKPPQNQNPQNPAPNPGKS